MIAELERQQKEELLAADAANQEDHHGIGYRLKKAKEVAQEAIDMAKDEAKKQRERIEKSQAIMENMVFKVNTYIIFEKILNMFSHYQNSLKS